MSDSVPTATDPSSQPSVDAPPPTQFYNFLVEGIRNDLEDIEGWHMRAEAWLGYYPDELASSYNYHVNALNRCIYQGKNVKNSLTCLRRSWNPGKRKLRLIGHSNGCAIICAMLQSLPFFVAAEVHLIAPAVDDNFDSPNNGLNISIAEGRVLNLFIYKSDSDSILDIAKSTRWVRWLNKSWGYGWMGKTGPAGMSSQAEQKTKVIDNPGFDHSTYFDREHFEQTMCRITHQGNDDAMAA